MKLLFERSKKDRGLSLIPPCDVEEYSFSNELLRQEAPKLPEMAEVDLGRHYTELMKQVHGVNDGFYPLGSCTMKYNPRINEETASLPGFTDIHPLQNSDDVQGCLEVMYRTKQLLCELTGMNDMTFQPAAGAHGEYTGLLLIRKYHQKNGDLKRTNIIVPDSAHGTNPASASMAGFKVINVRSNDEGGIDLEELKKVVNDETAGLMLTNPNTLGIFDRNILEVTRIIHEAGGLCYYDGANLNAIVGRVKPGDMGFDCIHLNLHKTFSTPHGGGGPGAGAVGCKQFLAEYLPWDLEETENSCGKVRSYHGSFLVIVKALAYILSLGKEGIPASAAASVLNANYFKALLSEKYTMANPGFCMHEFVMTLEKEHKEHGFSALDIAKGLLDNGIHPPTMYFPLIVHEALMAEPTETESRQTLEEAAKIFLDLYDEAMKDPESMQHRPQSTVIGRPDEVLAARKPVLRWKKEEKDEG